MRKLVALGVLLVVPACSPKIQRQPAMGTPTPKPEPECSDDLRRDRDGDAALRARRFIVEARMSDPPEEIQRNVNAVIRACETCCSDPGRAKLWAYLAVAFQNDPEKSRAALERAARLDPAVALDEDLATPQLSEALEREKRKNGP